jgi:hypothetical protein
MRTRTTRVSRDVMRIRLGNDLGLAAGQGDAEPSSGGYYTEPRPAACTLAGEDRRRRVGAVRRRVGFDSHADGRPWDGKSASELCERLEELRTRFSPHDVVHDARPNRNRHQSRGQPGRVRGNAQPDGGRGRGGCRAGRDQSEHAIGRMEARWQDDRAASRATCERGRRGESCPRRRSRRPGGTSPSPPRHRAGSSACGRRSHAARQCDGESTGEDRRDEHQAPASRDAGGRETGVSADRWTGPPGLAHRGVGRWQGFACLTVRSSRQATDWRGAVDRESPRSSGGRTRPPGHNYGCFAPRWRDRPAVP